MPRWITLLRYYCDARNSLPVYVVLSIGVALSVFVLSCLLALRQGFVETLAATGRTDQALVLSNPATSEVASFIRIDQGLALAQHSAIARDATGEPMASTESFSLSYLTLGKDDAVSVSVRGLSPAGARLREKLHVLQGRMFQPGTRELIVGQGLLARLPTLTIGQDIVLRGTTWRVVGSFATGDASQSEFWGDVLSVQNALRQRGYQSVTARFATPHDLERFRSDVLRDTTLNCNVLTEREYHLKNSVSFPHALGLIALLVGGVMACAAAVSASNSMLYLVDRRRQITGLLLSLGFAQRTVFATLLAEATLVAGSGAAVGWLLAYSIFDGRSVNTFNMQSYELVAFHYSVGWLQFQVSLALASLALVVGAWAVLAKVRLTPVIHMLARE